MTTKKRNTKAGVNGVTYRLARVAETDRGVFGVLLDPAGFPLCVTLENEWKGNARNISCIPDGRYRVVKHNGAKYRDVWRLEDVPGRTAILIHAGNTVKDTEGCILVGRSFAGHGVADSRVALNALRKRLPHDFDLVVDGLQAGDIQ